MSEYALWRSIKHFMVVGSLPAKSSRSGVELYEYARNQGWYRPAPAVIAEKRGSEWWPMDWVRRDEPIPLAENQPEKYAAVRAGKHGWPDYLGDPPQELGQV
jgi:hypothetical protein